MNQEKIGKFIAKCRKEKNMTQQELSEKIGVSDRTIGNWENGRNMPDLSLFKPLCACLDISLNDLMSGEKISEKEYKNKLEENIINTIDYTNKKIEKKNTFISFILIGFGLFISVVATTIFPSESSWGSIYSIFGIIVSLIGFNKIFKCLKFFKRLIYNLTYFLIMLIVLITIDFVGVANIHQAPRYSIYKISGDNIVYYDTLFYDVVRCNVNEENETFKIIKNKKYDKDNIDYFCKNDF